MSPAITRFLARRALPIACVVSLSASLACGFLLTLAMAAIGDVR